MIVTNISWTVLYCIYTIFNVLTPTRHAWSFSAKLRRLTALLFQRCAVSVSVIRGVACPVFSVSHRDNWVLLETFLQTAVSKANSMIHARFSKIFAWALLSAAQMNTFAVRTERVRAQWISTRDHVWILSNKTLKTWMFHSDAVKCHISYRRCLQKTSDWARHRSFFTLLNWQRPDGTLKINNFRSLYLTEVMLGFKRAASHPCDRPVSDALWMLHGGTTQTSGTRCEPDVWLWALTFACWHKSIWNRRNLVNTHYVSEWI